MLRLLGGLSIRLFASQRIVSRSTRAFSSTQTTANTASANLQLEGRETVKPILSRKTFLVDYYKYLNDKNEILLFVHHNNIPKNDNTRLRNELKKVGAQFNVITNSLYKVYLRSENESDPASTSSAEKNKEVEHPLDPLLNGPTAVISIPNCEPSVVSQVLKAIKAFPEKVFLVGAKVEASVYDIEDVAKFKDLPNLEQMHGQLAGLLTLLGGAGLVRTLEAQSNVLYLTLEERRKDIGGESE